MSRSQKIGYGLTVASTSATMVCIGACTNDYSACIDCILSGHAGAMLQARRLGKELLVGIHSDESILENKGPTVMTLKER